MATLFQPIDTAVSEAAYEEKRNPHLVSRKGGHGDKAQQERDLQFWVKKGAEGAHWLVARLVNEPTSDAITATTNALIAIGSPATPTTIPQVTTDVLKVEHLAGYLHALRWTADSARDRWVAEVESVISAFAGHPEPEVREAVYVVTKALPSDRRTQILTDAQRSEKDSELLELLDDLLRER